MSQVERVIVLRFKRSHPEYYRRNLEWLPKGLTAWWPIGEEQVFGGVVALVDSEKSDRIEVWVGRSKGPDSGKVNRDEDSGRWTLQVQRPFQCLGWIQAPGITAFLGTPPGNLLTYIERNPDLAPSIPGQHIPAREHPRRGFDPEKSGERTTIEPGTYTTDGTHAKVVNDLHTWLQTTQGYRDLDNVLGWHDLHGFSPEGRPELFEVKTGASNTDVFTALGQLQIYELGTGPSQKTLVLPKEQNAEEAWHERLFRLNLSLITYARSEDGHIFERAVPSGQWRRRFLAHPFTSK